MEVELFSGTYIYRMGRKAKITAVPIDQEEAIAPQVVDEEVKNDAQHMTEIINEMNAPEGLFVARMSTCSVEETPAEEAPAETPIVVSKAKAKRASKAKPAVVVEPVLTLSLPEGSQTKGQVSDQREVEVTASLDEVEAVVTLPLPGELKVDTKVACPDCGKQMSAKTLKYSHGPNCSAKKQKQEVEDQRDEEESQPNIVRNPLTEAILDNWKETRCTRLARAVRRQEMVDRLIQNAF